MADVVRLAIVYDTSQAAAQLDQLNRRGLRLVKTTDDLSDAATVSGGRLRGMALAGTRLATVMSQGDLSVKGLASSMGRLAGPSIAGALVVTIINLINAFQEFKRITEDISNTIDAMQTSARDARADVARLLNEAPPESRAEKAVKRLSDAVAQMRKEATRLGGAAGAELRRQADILAAEIPTIGARTATANRRDALKKVQDATDAYNKTLQDSDTILTMLNAGPLEQMNVTYGIQRKRLEELIASGKGSTAEAKDLAIQLQFGAKQMDKMERASRRLDTALGTVADAIEEFVVTGTLAFSDFLNNILRMLYRDFTGQLISGIVTHAAGSVGTGTVTGGAPDILGGPGGGPVRSVVTNVNFNVNTIDAASTAQFLESNGARIASIVAGQAGRSLAIRRKFQRG